LDSIDFNFFAVSIVEEEGRCNDITGDTAFEFLRFLFVSLNRDFKKISILKYLSMFLLKHTYEMLYVL
jgi:hypothetical protein